MATMDIFEGDAFTIIELTRALENIPFKPAILSGAALFSPAYAFFADCADHAR